MANTKNETADAPTPAYVSRPITAIPKKASSVEFDPAAANALLALVFADGAPKADEAGNILTASDGVAYPDKVKARTAANKAKRLIARVRPEGFNTETRVYQPEGQETWEWALWMAPAKVKAEAAAK
jgi:hypothetical protein